MEHSKTLNSQSGKLSLFQLTWPIWIEVLLFMLMGNADIFMLSAVSDDAVAAISVSNQFIMIAILILGVISNGAGVVVAQYVGSKKLKEAAHISGVSLTLNLLVGLIMSACFVLLSHHILLLFDLTAVIRNQAYDYLVIVGGGIAAQSIINSISSIIRTYGYAKECMFVSIFVNMLNIIGNYFLIFGAWVFPEWGIAGAAISTVVSRVIGVVIFFLLLYRLMEVKIKFTYYFRLPVPYILKILKIGFPSAIEQVMYQFTQSVFLFFVTMVGASALAARQYVMNVSMFIYLFSFAIGMATAIMVGRYIGERRQETAYHTVWNSLKVSMWFTLAINIAVILFRETLISIFTDDPVIIEISSQVLLLSLLLETGRTFNLILINALRASGDAQFPVWMGMISMFGISIPLGYLLCNMLELGLAGIWIAVGLDEWIRGMIMMFRWRSRAWEKKALVESPSEPISASAGA